MESAARAMSHIDADPATTALQFGRQPEPHHESGARRKLHSHDGPPLPWLLAVAGDVQRIDPADLGARVASNAPLVLQQHSHDGVTQEPVVKVGTAANQGIRQWLTA